MKLWPYIFLIIAICGDVFATASLKACAGFTKLLPSLNVLAGYAVVLTMLALSLKHLPFGITYAVWGGLGTVGAAIVGVCFFKELYDLPRLIGTMLIIIGTIIIYACPKSTTTF